jgi:hypothetical protein
MKILNKVELKSTQERVKRNFFQTICEFEEIDNVSIKFEGFIHFLGETRRFIRRNV